MIISAQEYKEKFAKTKIVTLEDGVEFEIRILSPIDLWEENIEGAVKSPTAFMQKVLTKGVVSPQLSQTDEEGKLNIRSIKLAHINKLSEEILEYSGYTEGGKKKEL